VAGDAERRLEELRAALHEKDREIERLTGLLDETRAALALLEEEQFNRRQAFLALEALQQGEEGPPPGAQAEEPPRAWWQARRRKTGSGE
jgi:chromosome segregation ATPase